MIKKKSIKELLGESLTELLGSKPFEKITVNEIVENCGVGRRTFYRNFRDKYELATWLYIRQLSEYTDSKNKVRLSEFIYHSARVVGKDQQLIIAVDKYRGQNSFRDSIYEPMVDLYINVIEQHIGEQVSEEMRKDIEFFVGGQITYVARVISNPDAPSPKDITAFFLRCIPESLEPFI